MTHPPGPPGDPPDGGDGTTGPGRTLFAAVVGVLLVLAFIAVVWP